MQQLPLVIREACYQLLGVTDLEAFPLSGGDIHQARRIECVQGRFFLKFSLDPEGPAMLATEAAGLNAIAQTGAIATPTLIGKMLEPQAALLLLEYIPAQPATELFWERFGEQLAALHQNSRETYGWYLDNYIGRLPQFNKPHPNWLEFYVTERLEPQVKLAIDQGALPPQDAQAFTSLYQKLESLLEAGVPALIHGDLWSGNFIAGPDDTPYLIDPAVSYAHGEMDLAMSRLFGGFERSFYRSYEATVVLPLGLEERLELYQLYYLLAHLNMFGAGYLSPIQRILRKFK